MRTSTLIELNTLPALPIQLFGIFENKKVVRIILTPAFEIPNNK